MENINFLNFTKDYIQNIDEGIISLLKTSFRDNMLHKDDLSFKSTLNLETDFAHYYSENNSLVNYLFLKTREYTISQLYTQLLYIYDIHTKKSKKVTDAIINIIEVDCNEKKGDLSNEDFLAGHESFNKTLKGYQNKLNKVIKDNLKDYLENQSMGYTELNPYKQFQTNISSIDNHNIFLNNSFLVYKFCNNDYHNIPIHFSYYIILLSNFAYRKGNLFSLSSTSLKYMFGNIQYPKYDKLKLVKENYNSDIAFINSTISLCEDSHVKFVLYYLFNHNYHNDFFRSLDNPFISYVLKRINIIELYQYTNVSQSFYEDLFRSSMLFEKLSINESMYHLRLLELLMKFDINLNDVDLEQDFISDNITPTKITLKDGSYKKLNLMQSNPFIHLKDMEYLYDKTISFFYDFLHNTNDWIQDVHNEHLNRVSDFITHSNDKMQEDNLKIVLEIINQLHSELQSMHSNDKFYSYKDIDINDSCHLPNQFSIYMYLIKNAFSNFEK